MHNTTHIEIFAGNDAQGRPFVERMEVAADDQGCYQLLKSPAFVKGLARGDLIQLDPTDKHFTINTHSGNLCVRVFSKDGIEALQEAITPELEKLGGELDIATPRMLVYSIHVSCGFSAIEAILNDCVSDNSTWLYGNVYDPADGTTPLNWWYDILKPQ
jgi:Domain of unknown function (DUF4265)